jgi:hypothetical protein
MSSKSIHPKKIYRLAALVFLLLFVFSFLIVPVKAEKMVQKRITIGSSFPSVNTTHSYIFTTTKANTIGSIQFQYCSNSPLVDDPCIAPVGLNVMSAGIANQSGITGFSVSGASNASTLILTRTPEIDAGTTAASFVFSNIINPSISNSANYVRIFVYDDISATGNIVDSGAVAFVIEDQYTVDAFVPPYITFCKGVTVSLNCDSSSGSFIDFGEFNPSATSAVTTQMSAATNDPLGYTITLNGQTMYSGSNIIPQLGIQTESQTGQSQFGLNLRANTVPSVGSDLQVGNQGNGVPSAAYNIPNRYRFNNGDVVAGSSVSTGFSKYTVSYIVNISPDQKAGIYATTLTYTALVNF